MRNLSSPNYPDSLGDVAMCQAYPASGTFNADPDHLNNNNTADWTASNTIDQYAVITFGRIVRVQRYRQFGNSVNSGTGRYKLQYWNLNSCSWVDWATGIAVRTTDDWSNFTTVSTIITTAIRLVSTTIDGCGSNVINEFEVIW